MQLKTTEKIRNELIRLDPQLAVLIYKYGDIEITLAENYFETLASSIVGQQLSNRVADVIWGRLVKLLGGEAGGTPNTIKAPSNYKQGGDIQVTPEAIVAASAEELRSVGLSVNKVAHLKNLSQAVIDGSLKLDSFQDLSDEEIITQLTKIKGIGRWTAEMFLIFSLGREDVFSLGDGGLYNATSRLYNLDNPTKKQLQELTQKWSRRRIELTQAYIYGKVWIRIRLQRRDKMSKVFITDDYLIKRFNKKEGLSGKLYLATSKDENDKWVIKNKNLDDALNEFVISTFANELNILMPECRLGVYNGKVSAFIKYIPNLKFLNRDEAAKDAYIYEQYLKQIFLAEIFNNDDYREIFIDDKNQVWQLDNAMGGLDDGVLVIEALRQSKTNSEAKNLFFHLINATEEYVDRHLRWAIEEIMRNEMGRMVALNTLLDIVKLDEESANNKNINDMFETIAKLTSEDLAEYFSTYLKFICNASQRMIFELFSEKSLNYQ